MGRKFSIWLASSLAITAATIYHAASQHGQFYPTVVALWTGKLSLLVLSNFFILSVVLFFHLLKLVFLGGIRDVEVTEVREQVPYAITDSLLSMTVFRADFDATFFALFVLLLFLKIFHWIVRLRVDYVAQSAQVTVSSLLRLIAFKFLLLTADVCFVWLAVTSLVTHGASVMLLFAFEATLLSLAVLASFGHLLVNLVDLRHDGQWSAKSACKLYIDFVAECANMLVYALFFAIVLANYGWPLNMMRQMYMTVRRFSQSVRDVITYRRATRNMNERFPDVTAAELAAENADATCIICRDEMTLAKRLPCGHVVHLDCLRDWLQRKQTCPLCRVSVLIEDVHDRSKLWRGGAAAVEAEAAAAAAAAAAAPAAAPAANVADDFGAAPPGAPRTPTTTSNTSPHVISSSGRKRFLWKPRSSTPASPAAAAAAAATTTTATATTTTSHWKRSAASSSTSTPLRGAASPMETAVATALLGGDDDDDDALASIRAMQTHLSAMQVRLMQLHNQVVSDRSSRVSSPAAAATPKSLLRQVSASASPATPTSPTPKTTTTTTATSWTTTTAATAAASSAASAGASSSSRAPPSAQVGAVDTNEDETIMLERAIKLSLEEAAGGSKEPEKQKKKALLPSATVEDVDDDDDDDDNEDNEDDLEAIRARRLAYLEKKK